MDHRLSLVLIWWLLSPGNANSFDTESDEEDSRGQCFSFISNHDSVQPEMYHESDFPDHWI
jgi:hypothetical protein